MVVSPDTSKCKRECTEAKGHISQTAVAGQFFDGKGEVELK